MKNGMVKVQGHHFWVILVIIVLACWISLIVVVVLLVKPKALENVSAEKRSSKIYPSTPNKCPHQYPFLYHLNLTQCSSLVEIAKNECPSRKVCLPYCPGMTYTPDLTNIEEIEYERLDWNYSRYLVVCVKSTSEDIYSEPPVSFDEYVKKVHEGLCADQVFRSNTFFNKLCLPIELDEPGLKHLNPFKDEEKKSKEERGGMTAELKRRSHEMFYLWIFAALGVSVCFICLYLILFLYFIRFTVYMSLITFFLLLVAGASYSLGMVVLSSCMGSKVSEVDPDLTLGVRWMYWGLISAILFFFFYLYCDFFRKCYYTIPKAVRFLIYVNRGIGGIKSALAFIFIGISLQILLIFCFIELLIVVFNSGHQRRRLTDTTSDCLCINGYVEGSDCNRTNYKTWCKDRISGGPCLQGSCDLYAVELRDTDFCLVVALILTTYYLMWFVKGSIDMILGTSFVHWYRDNFSANIPFKQFLKTTAYCLKYQSGTLAIGSLVMFCIGWFHVLFQFIEHLMLFTVEIKKVRRKRITIAIMERLSKVTSPLIYIEAGVYNISYCEALRRINITMADKIKNMRLINRLVDMVLFICALAVVVLTLIGLLIIYAFPHTFIDETKSRDIFGIMTSPSFILAVVVVSSYFLVANILSVYSISVNAVFLCYISDKPAEVSRKRKYHSSRVISEDMNPDKFDVLGKLNDLGETVAPGEKSPVRRESAYTQSGGSALRSTRATNVFIL